MNFKQIFILSFDAIKERKVKSILTIIMVMVGSSLMVAVGGIGSGFSEFFSKQTSNLAGNIMFVSPAQQTSSGGAGAGPSTGASTPPKITLNDAVENRLKSLPYVKETIPVYQASVTLTSQGKTKDYSVFAINPEKLSVLSPTLEYVEGSAVRQNDPSSVIISEDIAQPPGDEVPYLSLGQTVRMSYSFVDPVTGDEDEEVKSFVVRAIMKSTGNPNIDNAVVINPDVANTLFHKSGKFDAIIIVGRSAELIDAIEQEIRKLYGNNIGITTVKAIIETIKKFTSGISSFLLSIALVSLIVGAVGIITTLYTSVVERTREIGTLKAIGARDSYVLSLFLVEALLIGILGATSGLSSGMVFGYLLSSGMGSGGQPPIVPVYTLPDLTRVWFITVGLSFMAGLFPSLKAARLLPVLALKRD
ncbi:ABC transporter permease [Candidatus Nitrosocosmicus agrestis]|jgi:putative ABC transport system permease protein|uniref:ABC transporter permease n=1 Tax=Candidatus Nitrosocosmicus agrestis TaxID=2563600 RepID=UPI00122E0594|nr:ABC transporter permease [Candidatus Nitrosocosmicus sp. SS]KAA2283571.1 ABC transporter permease [Candidatus Nitrosocosmicus sp. SS]KAF0869652.1 ABC transporter permease [Candidatus Nitrosocosmicus sp. SS]